MFKVNNIIYHLLLGVIAAYYFVCGAIGYIQYDLLGIILGVDFIIISFILLGLFVNTLNVQIFIGRK